MHRIIKIKELYLLFLNNNDDKIYQYRKEAITLFNKAETKDKKLAVVQHIGLGYINSGLGSVFKNFPTKDLKFTKETLKIFEETIGTFKQNIKNTFNIIYWIDFFLFFPQKLMKYFEIEPNVLATKIVQIIYWFFLTILAIFKNKIEVILTNYFDKFF